MENEPAETGGFNFLPNIPPSTILVGLFVLAVVVAMGFAAENQRLRTYIAEGGAEGVKRPCQGCQEKAAYEAALYDFPVEGGLNGYSGLREATSADSGSVASSDGTT